MNERIKELAKEAGLSYIPSSNSGPLRVEYLFPELEKFAELVVKECAKIAWEDSDRCARFYNDTIMNGKADVLALCSHHIKEHFGVKE